MYFLPSPDTPTLPSPPPPAVPSSRIDTERSGDRLAALNAKSRSQPHPPVLGPEAMATAAEKEDYQSRFDPLSIVPWGPLGFPGFWRELGFLTALPYSVPADPTQGEGVAMVWRFREKPDTQKWGAVFTR